MPKCPPGPQSGEIRPDKTRKAAHTPVTPAPRSLPLPPTRYVQRFPGLQGVLISPWSQQRDGDSTEFVRAREGQGSKRTDKIAASQVSRRRHSPQTLLSLLAAHLLGAGQGFFALLALVFDVLHFSFRQGYRRGSVASERVVQTSLKDVSCDPSTGTPRVVFF